MAEQEKKRLRFRSPSLAFIICLLFSIFGWFSINLSKDYAQTVSYVMTLTQVPEYVSKVTTPDSIVTVTIQMSGFSFLKYTFSEHNTTLPISVQEIINEKDKRGTIVVTKKELRSYLIDKQLIIAKSIEVETPDNIRFYIEY